MNIKDTLIVNVATDSWVRGQQRLRKICDYQEQPLLTWTQALPAGSPPHRNGGFCPGALENCRPYAFKAYALKDAADKGHHLLLWADASVVPLRRLDALWERIERDGYWICRNGYRNSEWTDCGAYAELFHEEALRNRIFRDDCYNAFSAINAGIEHVVATAFGLNIDHPKGRKFFDEYFRLASKTKAFCGPWHNSNSPIPPPHNGVVSAPCGPPTTRGHRHDQTAASVIAWRLGFILDDPGKTLAYEGGELAETMLAVRAF